MAASMTNPLSTLPCGHKNICYETLRAKLPPRSQFLKNLRVNTENGCWDWKGATWGHPRYKAHKYGMVKVQVGSRRISKSAHVYAYELCVGQVPEGMELDHKCNNKLCVNPDHLQPLTHQQNAQKRPYSAVSPERRSEIARHAMAVRWGKK